MKLHPSPFPSGRDWMPGGLVGQKKTTLENPAVGHQELFMTLCCKKPDDPLKASQSTTACLL